MSVRLSVLVLVVAVACGGSDMKVHKGEPQTAREKMLAEEKAHPSDADEAPPSGKGGTSKKWTGWRYQGERKDCFFVVGKKCFKTENAACQAAHCKAPSSCSIEGAGPSTMKCVGGAKSKSAETEQGRTKRPSKK